MVTHKYADIVAHYESCLERYGDTHLGVDWPKEDDVKKRYQVMLDVVKTAAETTIKLLDFGCGAAHLYEYILRQTITNIEYSGLDISEKFIELSQKKFPQIKFYYLDILKNDAGLLDFDYIVMNGVFTEKRSLSYEEMLPYFKQVILKVFAKAKRGIAFNVMSSHVDWQRDDLFHLPLDTLAAFLVKNLSRNFVIRNDYGLYEYTVYVYKAGD